MTITHDVEIRELVNIAGETHFRAWCRTCDRWATRAPVYFYSRRVVERHAESHESRMVQS
jgi:hypothetical protein